MMQQLHNVAIGRVFLCAGQSNMEMSINAACVNGTEQCQEEMQDAINYPYLRMYTVHHDNSSVPLEMLRSPPAKAPERWLVSHPSSFYPGMERRAGFEYFSATCYFFGRELYTLLNGTVPIGLISSTWGGTRIQSWTRREVMQDECGNSFSEHGDSIKFLSDISLFASADMQQARSVVQQDSNTNGILNGYDYLGRPIPPAIADASLFNAMIHPLRRLSLSGMVWYQGESNQNEAELYQCLFPAMITDWRRIFGKPTLPFSFVQLAPDMSKNDTHDFEQVTFEDIRFAQAKGGLERVNHTSMAVALDLGDAFSPLTPIHPRRKKEVGRRLALGMYHLLFGDSDPASSLVHTGPLLKDYTVEYLENGAIMVTFSFDPRSSHGLHTKGGADCDKIGRRGPWCCEGNSPFVVHIERGSNDSNLHPEWHILPTQHFGTNETTSQVQVQFTHQEMNGRGRPMQLGLHWRTTPPCVLYNDEGLPAPPFLIDL
jgi:sialate O-acetylesterase